LYKKHIKVLLKKSKNSNFKLPKNCLKFATGSWPNLAN